MYDDLVKDLRENHDKYFARDMQAADAIVKLMRRCEQFQYTPPPAWIPVTERLPERFKSVLTVDKYGVITFNWISGDGKNWSTGYHITHWMPTPPAPKEE